MDFIAEYYSKMQNSLREKHVEETAELVIEKLREKKLVYRFRLDSSRFCGDIGNKKKRDI